VIKCRSALFFPPRLPLLLLSSSSALERPFARLSIPPPPPSPLLRLAQIAPNVELHFNSRSASPLYHAFILSDSPPYRYATLILRSASQCKKKMCIRKHVINRVWVKPPGLLNVCPPVDVPVGGREEPPPPPLAPDLVWDIAIINKTRLTFSSAVL